MDAGLAVVISALLAAASPVYLRLSSQRQVRTAEQERKDAALLGVEAAAYARARSYDQEVINSLTARIERAERHAQVMETRATAAERRVAILERTLIINGIALPHGDEEPRATLPPMVQRMIHEAGNGDTTPEPVS